MTRKKNRTLYKISKNSKIPKKKKGKYYVINWPEYNRALIRRGEFTFWIDDEARKHWKFSGPYAQGAPYIYSDVAILALLTIRSLFHLNLRSVAGFMQALVVLMHIELPVPDFTTLCRRQKKLQLPVPVRHLSTEPMHLVVDSTGLKVYGEGEWKVRRYGYSRHRMWRKLHVIVEPKTGQILAHGLTTNSVTDADGALPLLDQLKDPIASVTGDGGYDQWKIYDRLHERGITAIIPPDSNAVITQHGNCSAPPLNRDEALRSIRKIGRSAWKRQTGYHQRSLAETCMFRYKSRFGDKPLAHSLENQRVEVGINCMLLNQFLDFGRPISYPVFA